MDEKDLRDAQALRMQLRDRAQAASVAWPQLIRRWSWSEINEYDAVRRLLVWAVAWVEQVGVKGVPVDQHSAQRLSAELAQANWPDSALALHAVLRECAELAHRLLPFQAPPSISDFDLYRLSDAARILLTVCAAERAAQLLGKRGVKAAHRVALRDAITWARSIGEGRRKLESGAEVPYLQAIAALHWSGRDLHIANSVRCCLQTAGNPWIWEMSQARFQHLVASVELHHAVRAGVPPADIGRDYLQLQQLQVPLP